MMRFRRGTPSRSSTFDTMMDSVMGELFPRNSRAKRPGMGGSRQRPRTKRQDFALELMEPRLLLSADLSFTTSTNHDVTVRFDGSSNVQIVDTAANTVLAAQSVGTTSAVRITGSSSADHVTVDLSNPFVVPVFFNDATDPDDDELSVVGSDVVSWSLSGADEGSVAAGGGITFTGVENLSGDAGNRDTFVIGDTALLVGTIDGGAGGFDSVVMKSPSAVTLTNAQIETNLGALQFDIAGFESAVFEAPSLDAAAFSGQTLLTTGLAQWTSQGPGALNAGQVRLPPDNFVTGAVQDVAIHPFDLSSMYVGTVGGGVWKNSDISVLFEFEKFEITDLTAAATARLMAFADFLKVNPSLNVKVVGHTDDTGDQDTVNQPLSVNRANTVKQFLVNQGIDASRLVASGRGELEPVDTNSTDAGREHNRRVELIVNHWVPLTDQFPTLSISALVISPRDADGALVTASTPTSKLVLYAGTGSTSSGSALFNNLGATTAIGILKSSDGGATWTLLDQLAGNAITSMVALRNGDLVVSTKATGGNGLFRSTDGGQSFIDIADARTTDGINNDGDTDTDEADEALFDRAVSDLAQDPGSPTRVYAAVPRVGVFISNDNGATWAPVNNAGLTNVANAKRIVLATSPLADGANHPVYVALIGDTETLAGPSAVGTLQIVVPASTVLEGARVAANDGDVIQIWGSGFDGVDNDGDGLTDALDPKERPATVTDLIDNDGDGLVDADDPSESGLTDVMRVASVGAVVGGTRTVTLAGPGADGFDNNNDGNIDEAAEAGLAVALNNAWGAGATVRFFQGSQHRLSGLFRSDNLGANWALLAQPGTTEATGGFHAIHRGAQGDTHFSLVVDPVNPDVLYIGGDTQPATGAASSIGATEFAGRLFRFDGAGNWAAITDNGANNTSPHGDSRNAVFRGIHMINVNDGGIVELRNANDPARTWRSLNDDLSLSEFYSLAYDPIGDIILGGLQDIGNALQTATDSPAWTSVSKGDGAIVGFSNGNPIYSSQNLGGFTIGRAGILAPTAAGATVIFLPAGTNVRTGDTVEIGGFIPLVSNVTASTAADVGVPLGSVKVTLQALPNPFPAGTIAQIRPPGVPANITGIRFTTPFAVNTVNPTDLLIGTNAAFESAGPVNGLGRVVTALGTTTGAGSNNIGQVNSIVYGGQEAGVAKPTVIWLGTAPNATTPQTDQLWLRNSASAVGGAVSPVASYTTEVNTAVKDIAVDPTDWRRVWVLDTSGRIWFSPNAGQAAAFDSDDASPDLDKFWKQVDPGLSNLPGAFLLQQIAAAKVGGTDVLLAGGQGGVFRKIGDNGPWHEYGVGLPNALNTVIKRIGGVDDLLLAGTFGRGAWTLDNASQTLATPTVLTITGSGDDDEIVLRRNATQPWLLDVFLFADGAAEPALPSYSIPFANLTDITIDVSGAGDDDVLIDGDFGSVVTSNATVNVTGGTGTDRLFITPTLDPEDVIFAGTQIGTPANGSQISLFLDAFNHIDAQKVVWTNLDQVNETVAAVPTVEGIANGLQALADALTEGLAGALDGIDLPGIDAASLARALNGVIVEKLRPKDQALVTPSQVPGSDVIQVDNGTSVLLRLLEAGGLDIGHFKSGAVTDPNALEAALEALDTGAANADNVQLTVNPADGDPTIDDDLLYDVKAVGLTLDGVVDLATLGGLELTGLLDVRMTLDLSLAFGFDSKGFFIRTTGATLPTITITNLVISGEAVGVGTLGFLGVDMSKATLTLDPGVKLKFTLGDPATTDDNLIRADELLAPPNPNQLITFAAVSDGDANPDLILNATLDVSAIVPGVDSGISLATAEFKLTWGDITDPLSVDLGLGVTPGTDAAEFLRFLQFNAQDVVEQLTTLRNNLDTLYGQEIPFLSDSLTEIVGLVTTFQQKVLDPLTGASGFEVPSIQALIRNLAEGLGITPEQLGLAYNKMNHELTYHLVLSEQLVDETKALGGGIAVADGLADLEFHTDATVDATISLDTVIGIDLDDFAGSGIDWFFLRDASATAQATIEATDIEASARFGFLSIGIDEGTLTDAAGSGPMDVSLTVQLVHPDTGLSARVNLQDILDNLDNLGDLLDISGGGSAKLVLPVESDFLPGLPDIPDGGPVDLTKAITVTITDIADPSTFHVEVGTGLTDLGNFLNIDAPSIVGALGQLTFWLDEFRRSDAFANLDVPLVGPALDEALQFADAFRDLVLIDDNDTQLDNDKTLLFDLNAALEDAGLGRKFFAANEGGHITLVALDPSITGFTVAGAEALGFSASQASSVPTGHVFPEVVATNAFADAEGNLGSDLSFTVTIGTGTDAKTYTVEVKKADTDANTAIGDDRWKLVNADNAPTFATAQQMRQRLLDVFGASVPGLTYDQVTDTLNFSLDLSQVFANINLPFSFDLDNLPDYLQLQTSGALAFKVSGGLNLDVGIFLGNAEPTDKLQSGTLLANLSEPVVLNDNQRYDAQQVIGKLTADAHFSVSVDGAVAVPVTVTKLATSTNTTLADLIADINAALTTAGLNTKVVAQAVPAEPGQTAPQQVQFKGLAVTTSLAVTAAAGDTAVTEIGLATSATATGANPTLKAAKTVAPMKGRLTADAGFRVELTKNNVTTNFDIALTPAQTQDNSFAFSIVNDIQTLLDPNKTRVRVDFSNYALTFSTVDGSTIAISNVTGTATNELGIVAGDGNTDDLVITLRSGSSYRIAFDSSDTTIQQIIDAIEDDTSDNVSVAINAAGSGLTLTDETFDDVPAGTGTFKVQALNNSTAGLLLGIVRPDSSGAENDPADGVIEGADIAALTALDRFFVKATPVGIDPLAGLTVEIGTPTPLTASAKFGFVDLGLQGVGGLDPSTSTNNALQAALTLRLLEPAGSTDGRVSLAEMIGALDNLSSMFTFSLTGQGALDLSLTPATITSLSGLGIDVGAGPRIRISADMTANAFATPPVFSVTTQGFDELDVFGNVDFNFQSIIAGLAALVDFLDDFEALSFLNDPIPVIDVSVKDLVGFAKQFGDAVTAAENDPAGSLQSLRAKLLAAFGLPPNSPALNLLLVDGPTAGSKLLKIDTNFLTTFSKSLPINIDLGAGLPFDFGGGANLQASGSLALSADFGFDIADPTNLYVFDTTGVTAWLDLDALNLEFKAAAGPLGIFVTGGAASIKGSLAPTGSNTLLTAGFTNALGDDDMIALGEIDFGDLAINAGAALDVDLPVYFPTESNQTGTLRLDGTLGYTGGQLTANLIPSAVDPAGHTITLDQLFDFDPGNLSLLDGLLLGVDGADMFLGGLEDLLDGTLGDFTLPLIGDKLSGAADAIGDFRDGFVEKFRKAIEDLANPALAFAEAGIGPATGTLSLTAASVPQGKDPVSVLLLELLGPSGLGFVHSANDIVFDTNIQTETDPSKVFFDWDIHLSGTLADAGAGIGFDLGIPGLGFETEGEIHLDVDWALDFGFGINMDDGFFFDIGDSSELELNARVTTPGLAITGRLGFLQIEATENVEADEGAGAESERGNTGLTVQFAVDINNRQDPLDTRLGFAELGRIGVDASIAGQALADLQMALKLNSDLVPNPGNFPSVVADFAFDWSLGTVDDPDTVADEFAGVELSALDGSFLKNGLNFIGFDDIGLDLGKYFSDVIGPIVEKVQEVTEPIKPFLDFLTEPIPVISDLAGPTSLLDIAAMSGFVNPGIIKAIEIVDQVVDIVSDLESAGGTTILYVDSLLPGGALTIYEAPQTGLLAATAAGIPGFDPSKPVNLANLHAFVDTLPDELGVVGDALGAAADAFSKAVVKMRPGGAVHEGFSLPIIENPSQIFGLLLGQPADLITFTMAPLELEAEFSAFFSILGPLGVSINAEFDAQFGPFTFGYDTLGITRFAQSDFRNPGLLFDGLFIGDLDAQGTDIPELQFDAGLWAAAELNLAIARGGVGGGLFAEIDFNLYDPDHDGKVRITELANSIGNAVRDGYSPLVAPLAIFDISGKLTAELFAFVKVDIPFFPIDERIQITDPIELLKFENVFVRRPTLATELGDGVLQLNMGKNAASRTEGNLEDIGETFFVKQGSDANHVKVWSPTPGIGVDEAHAQEYEATNLILAFGGEGNDTINFSGVTSAVKLEVYGDVGNDIIVGTSGSGAALIIGGAGDDTLTGGGGDDTIFGETGVDKLWGGAGKDWLFGDGDHEEFLVGSVITAEVKSSDGNDELYGQDGDDLLIGSGGVDKLEGGANDDVLIGDGGQLTMLDDRRVATTRPAASDPLRLELAVSDTSKNGEGAGDNLDGGSGNDHLYGGFGNDTLKGGDNDDVIYGELGVDTITGEGGNDVLFGDFGTFELEQTGLEPVATVGGDKDDISGGAGNDKLIGGAGNDILHGNEGDDVLRGGVGRDKLWGDNEDASATGADKLYGDADSDELRGGPGDDYLEGGGGNDLALGGTGDDTLVGGYGSDTLDGEENGDTYRISVRGGTTTELTTALDTGSAGVDSLIVTGTARADTLLLRAMADSYFPTLEKLQGLIKRFFESNIADRLAAMLQAFNDAYGPWDPAHGLYQALTDEYQEGLAAKLKAAVVANPSPDPDAPTNQEIFDIIDEVLASDAASKLDALQKAITAAYAAAGDEGVDVPNKLFSALTEAYKRTDNGATGNGALADIMESIVPFYVRESLYPAKAGLQLYVDEVYANERIQPEDRLESILELVGDAFIDAFAGERAAILDALQDAWDNLPEGSTEDQQRAALQDAIDSAYTADPVKESTFTNTAFVAVINEGGAAVERFNYRHMEGMVVNTMDGDDYVVLDDLLAAATINLGEGNDRVQVGQVFRSERVKDPEGQLITGIRAEDVFTTVEITRGWLSNGVSVPTTIFGNGGDDDFTVFHNVAVLNLNGGDGDDVFTVRAFALKGSTDNERARTDMKGDGGADTILYVVNAPVGIDGGDGLDTVRIVGTEFGDDIVVTDSGVFGAGLNVTYVNIERLVADGAEGDDRFFVMSTGLDVVTEIDGGLGSDTFFVGGNPSRAPVAVVSNDLRGHSGIILHSVESNDTAWNELPVEGLSANVGDNEDAMILVSESGGRSWVVEMAAAATEDPFANPLPLGAIDTYRLRLSHAPAAGTQVALAVVPAGLSPEDLAKNYADIEVWDPTLIFGKPVGWAATRTVFLNEDNWDEGVEVMFRATPDVGDEGRRFTFINHKITEATTDSSFLEAQTRSIKVQMEDDERDAVIVIPSGAGNTVLEGPDGEGFTDSFSVMLSHVPSGTVTVTMSVTDPTLGISLDTYSLTFEVDDTNGKIWSTPQTVKITAVDDPKIEGFHVDYISFDVKSDADKEETKGPFLAGDVVKVNGTDVTVTEDGGKAWLQLDGDLDDPGIQSISSDEKSTFVLTPHRPIANTVRVRVGGVGGDELAPNRFSVNGNTITFLTETGAPEFLSGKVEVNYQYKVSGYDGFQIRDQVVDIYDNDTPTVIVRPVDDGMVDVVENDPNATDTYKVRLSQRPTQTVNIVIDSIDTRTTWGRSVHFANQLLLSDNDETDKQQITLTFTPDNWKDEQTVTVRAYDDTVLDGNDTQVFAPDLQTVNKIRGPLVIEGAAGAGSLTLPEPLMMPWELNILESDGNVVAFQAAQSATGLETMTIEKRDLDPVVARFQQDDPTFILDDLVGKTLQMSKGPGTAIVLDPNRPNDTFDRFWLITSLEVLPDDDDPSTPQLVTLVLQNPTAVDPTQPNVTAPDSTSEYAITSQSLNFFADEREQVDYMFVYDSDSVADDVGALTSMDGYVLGFVAATGTMTVETSALQRVAKLLGLAELDDLADLELTITVGPGTGHVYKIAGVSTEEGDTKELRLTNVSGSGTPTNRSEFRIAGSDRYGRITGFGMGPNILFSGRPQGGGITYGDLEVVQVDLGRGNDTVRVDYATNSEDHSTVRTGDFYTLTMLNTGAGIDKVTVTLDNGDSTETFDGSDGDGAFALNTGDGNDEVLGAASTRELVVFGGRGDDRIVTGSGDDIVFGDLGRVDYTKKFVVDGQEYDAVITRLGSSVPQNPVNPHVTFATDTTISDSAILGTPYEFPTDYDGLVGLSVQVISPEGHVQFRTAIANTADTITVDTEWTQFPVFDAANKDDNFYYRVSAYPDDQTDGQFRTPEGVWSIRYEVGGADSIEAGGGDDIVIGGAGSDNLDGGANADLMFGDNVRLDGMPGSGNAIEPRFRTLTGSVIYGADGLPQVDARGQDVPGGNPSWADFSILLDQTLDATHFGDDYIAGGAGDDEIFGQLGNDVIQGDGSITSKIDGNPATAAASAARVDVGGGLFELMVNPSFESAGDGDDYIEGNAGADMIFGNLGQDDLIGGSSTLFSLTTPALRADGADLIFGGAGTDLARNNMGDGSHGRDADAILGDNGNIYRLVGPSGYLNFNYDDAYGIQIVPRALELKDYTPGGPDRYPLSVDIGAADEIHGESGDDQIYGMTGNDVLFGEGEDDVLIAGWGDDWISGGSGDDGILGDDGRLAISRNSTVGEPLYGVAGIPAAQLNTVVSAMNDIQFGIINVEGLLKYTADLSPDNLDPRAVNDTASTFYRPQRADDIIYGGWGHDAIHGGAGDDAVSGAEAMQVSYTNNYDMNGVKLNGAAIRSDYLHPFNPGNVLGYNPTTTKFALFDATSALTVLRKTLLNPATGALVASGGVEWLLNFASNEGPLDDHWSSAPNKKQTDGDDHIFGDLGNDWLVGGTGRDSLWAGRGDDLMNGDDVLSTNPTTDTDASYEDLMYGGAGRDVLLINTNGDRAIDWVGEFNSYFTPFSEFGFASVLRLIQTGVPEYLTALSRSQGSDPTLSASYVQVPGDNPETLSEIGMVLQGESEYGAQRGPPRDPQPGNLKGKVDVTRSAGTLPIYQTAGEVSNGQPALLGEAELAAMAEQVKALWSNVPGITDAMLARLDGINVAVGNLEGAELGMVLGDTLLIDADAAGFGWFVDATPGESSEFTDKVARDVFTAAPGSDAYGHYDLATVLAHELGHVLGFDHEDAARFPVMREELDPGMRYVMAAAAGTPSGKNQSSPTLNNGLLLNGSSTPLLTLGSSTNLDTLRVHGLEGTDTFSVTTAGNGRSHNGDGALPSGKKKSTDNLNMLYTPPRPTIIHSPATKGPVADIVDLDYGTARFVVQYD
jgi:Ca2+-binding RTX toxin-like protein/outer membrane protein OmpA-like peptidoglycan-associated protein